jgi:hypothetical protein
MYHQAYDCPNCGSAVPFPSAIGVFAVCAYCRSNVVRRDAQVELFGQQAQLPPDISPLQVGTQGRFDGHAFTLIGRIRMGYSAGSWNEWCADFGDGRWGWVAEAQGFYMVSAEFAAPASLLADEAPPPKPAGSGPKFEARLLSYRLEQGRRILSLGREFTLEGHVYRVRDTKQTEIVASEGSLPFAAVMGRSAISADLGGDGTRYANLEFSEDGVRMFLGRYCRFEELHFTDLRPLPGWTTDRLTKEAGGSDALNCPKCGAAVELRAAGLSMSAVCAGCGTILDTSHPTVALINSAKVRQHVAPLIPIGRRGRLRGTDHECIGFMVRKDNWGHSWHEYLLFNPFAGFRWLVTYQGHWSFVNTRLSEPPASAGDISVEGRTYRRFSEGTAEVRYVIGEFYWQVRLREQTTVKDYVAPPFVLSCEGYSGLSEVTWSEGEYLPAAEIQQAFALTEPLPQATGAYLNQPNPHTDRGRTLRWLLPVFAVLLLVIGLYTAATRARETVLDENHSVSLGSTNAATTVSEPFRIGGNRPQVVRFELESEVSNGWIEADINMVNTQTKEVLETAIGVEFWSGWDEGQWTEGSRRARRLLPAVPPGEYRLVLDFEGQPGVDPAPTRVRVVRDVMVWSNLLMGLLALIAYPVYRWLREHAFERERWSASDFSPFTPLSELMESDTDD